MDRGGIWAGEITEKTKPVKKIEANCDVAVMAI